MSEGEGMTWLHFAALGFRMARILRSCPSKDEIPERTAFIHRGEAVARACIEAGGNEDMAAAYMEHVLRCTDKSWWREKARVLCEGWFIWQYCVSNGLIDETEEIESAPPVMLAPENVLGQAQICTERLVRHPEQGRIRIFCTPPAEVLTSLGYVQREGFYARRVDECAGGIDHRAAEAGDVLLAAGYALTLEDEAMKARILSGDYEEEKRCWIRETGREDMLRLTYPHDAVLHRYICMAGGRWNGKYVEMPIVYADRLDDLIRLYGFSITDEAARRIDAWHQALRTATVYRPRKKRQETAARPEDMFKQMMLRKTEIPPDLLDEDI